MSPVKKCPCVENVLGSTQHIFRDIQNYSLLIESFPAVFEPIILQVTPLHLDAIAQKVIKATVNVFTTNIARKY
jgi:hypothetical protein